MSSENASLRFRGPQNNAPASRTESESRVALEKPSKSKRTRANAADVALALAYSQLAYTGLFFGALAVFRNNLQPFYRDQYLVADGSLAGQGPWDVALVITSLLAVISARALLQVFTIKCVVPFTPITKPGASVRFAEQLWCIIYYGGDALAGTYLLHFHAQYSWSPAKLWAGFPHYYLDPYIKLYYLAALGYWISQIYIIFVEKRRKDHWQMFTHHIVTCALVMGSYIYSYTRIGHLVLILMDSVDVVLSLAKCIKYLGYNTLCDICFILFLISWVVCRHIIYCYQIGWALLYAPAIIDGNCAHDIYTGKVLSCFGYTSFYIFAVLTAALQVITIMWFVLIVKVVLRVVRGQNAEEPRSDDEDDDVDVDDEHDNELSEDEKERTSESATDDYSTDDLDDIQTS